jgi:hypothetical protein
MKGMGVLLLVVLAAVALVGCDLIGGGGGDLEGEIDENGELNDGNDDQSDPGGDSSSFLTPYSSVLFDDVSLDGNSSVLPDDFSEEDMVPMVLMSVMGSMQESASAIEELIGGDEEEARSISAMLRLEVEDEDLELGEATFGVEYLDLELAAGIDSFSALLSNMGSESTMVTDLLMDIALSGRAGISAFTSISSTAEGYSDEPLDFAESLYLDFYVEEFEMAEDTTDDEMPEITGTLSVDLNFSAATNVVFDMELENTYRIPSKVEFEMRPLERSVENVFASIVQVQNGDGFETLMGDEDAFMEFCNDFWGTSGETGFVSLTVKMETDVEPLQAELVDFEIMEFIGSMMK